MGVVSLLPYVKKFALLTNLPQQHKNRRLLWQAILYEYSSLQTCKDLQ